MRIIDPHAKILSPDAEGAVQQMKTIELGARNCYKSEDKICEGSADKIIGLLKTKKHHSVLEHSSVSVRVVGSRAMSHQLVRARLMSYSQESQRFVNYCKDKHNNEVVFIKPQGFDAWSKETQEGFNLSMKFAEKSYSELVRMGLKAEQARNVLPNACKTEVVMSGNLRSWMHFFELRCDKHAQDEIRFIAIELLRDMYKLFPAIFDDLYKKFIKKGKKT